MRTKWFVGCNTPAAVKKRYRDLANQHHPDRGGKEADMKEINIEYKALTKFYSPPTPPTVESPATRPWGHPGTRQTTPPHPRGPGVPPPPVGAPTPSRENYPHVVLAERECPYCHASLKAFMRSRTGTHDWCMGAGCNAVLRVELEERATWLRSRQTQRERDRIARERERASRLEAETYQKSPAGQRAAVHKKRFTCKGCLAYSAPGNWLQSWDGRYERCPNCKSPRRTIPETDEDTVAEQEMAEREAQLKARWEQERSNAS